MGRIIQEEGDIRGDYNGGKKEVGNYCCVNPIHSQVR